MLRPLTPTGLLKRPDKTTPLNPGLLSAGGRASQGPDHNHARASLCSHQWPRNPLEPSPSEGIPGSNRTEPNRAEASHVALLYLHSLSITHTLYVCTIARRDENPADKIKCLTALGNYELSISIFLSLSPPSSPPSLCSAQRIHAALTMPLATLSFTDHLGPSAVFQWLSLTITCKFTCLHGHTRTHTHTHTHDKAMYQIIALILFVWPSPAIHISLAWLALHHPSTLL